MSEKIGKREISISLALAIGAIGLGILNSEPTSGLSKVNEIGASAVYSKDGARIMYSLDSKIGVSSPVRTYQFCKDNNLVSDQIGVPLELHNPATLLINAPACADGRLTPSDFSAEK